MKALTLLVVTFLTGFFHVVGHAETTTPATKAFEAVRNNKVETLKALGKTLDLGSVRDGFGNTLLIEAASKGRTQVVSYLLSKKVDINAKNQNDETAIWFAMENNESKIFDQLAKAGANLEVRSKIEKDTLLIRASQNNNVETVDKLLKAKPSLLNLQNARGETALIIAAQFGNKGPIQYLLKSKADKAIKDKSGLTALQHAQKNDLKETMQLLR